MLLQINIEDGSLLHLPHDPEAASLTNILFRNKKLDSQLGCGFHRLRLPRAGAGEKNLLKPESEEKNLEPVTNRRPPLRNTCCDHL